jgi:hypothetical protein
MDRMRDSLLGKFGKTLGIRNVFWFRKMYIRLLSFLLESYPQKLS